MTRKHAIACLIAGLGCLSLMLLIRDASGHLYGQLGLIGVFALIAGILFLGEAQF
jgi:hypothetical protein